MNMKTALPILAILAIVGAGAAGYYYTQYQKAQKEIQTIRTDPSLLQEAAKEETKRLIVEVGKIIALPTDEEPTVATITDFERLKDQPFFKNSQNGDKVLIYPKNKKAIIYRPGEMKVIDVAPVNIGTPSAQTASPRATSTPAPSPKP